MAGTYCYCKGKWRELTVIVGLVFSSAHVLVYDAVYQTLYIHVPLSVGHPSLLVLKSYRCYMRCYLRCYSRCYLRC